MANENADPKVIEGTLVVPEGARFALVASRFNNFIVDRLVEGAMDALTRHGARAENCTLVRVPGSWELPIVCGRLAGTNQFDAIIALSAVIRGGTPHFDYVAAEVAKGVAQVGLQTGVPTTFGVLTTDTIEQAVERAGTKGGNKGFDAALAAIEMSSLGRALNSAYGPFALPAHTRGRHRAED
jgi:6,7-dimethyl-8-ribityllumazine synthase